MSVRPLKMSDVCHGVVMSHPGADRIPAAIETARYFGMKSQHYGWPGMTRTPDGDLLVSASERIRHVDPFGRTVVARSTDNGQTWSTPDVVFDSATDDRDIALCTLPDGTVVATWFSSSAWAAPERILPIWEQRRKEITDDTLAALSRGWLRRSSDGGRTWEAKVYPTIVGLHGGPVPLACGDLIYCGYIDMTRMIATRSSDGGRTWAIVGDIPCDLVTTAAGVVRTAFNENSCIELSPEDILCALRPTEEPRNVHLTRSRDGGRTWTKPQDLGVYGFPPSFARLSDGNLLLVYASRKDPQRILGVLSYDNGDTWDTANEFVIREFEHRADMGYPRAIEVAPGEVMCIYYYVPHPSPGHPCPAADHLDPAQVGILSTRFKLS